MDLRDASAGDAVAIAALYNATVATTTVQWTEEPDTVADREAWLDRQVARGFPVLVAEDDTGEVVGFASYGDFRDSAKWPGYRFTVEHTIHVAERCWGRGVGRQLMEGLIARAVAAGLHRMVGGIDGDNDASIRFHERLGFVEVARMPQIGWKFGRWLDLVLMQLALDEARP